GDPSTGPKARVSYVAYYYDALNRLTVTVNVGTNGGTGYTRPSTPPSSSATALVSTTYYSADDLSQVTVDPRGLSTTTQFDNLGRTTKTIVDYTNGTPTANSNQTTEYTYDGDGHTLTVQVDLPGGQHQTTQYVYGVTISGNSTINSNDMLAATYYPDPSTGNADSNHPEAYTRNALGQVLHLHDRNSTVHGYTYDVLGRQTSDAVLQLGTGTDGSVVRIDTPYDGAGRPYLHTSYNSSGAVVNQIQDAYTGLGQL